MTRSWLRKVTASDGRYIEGYEVPADALDDEPCPICNDAGEYEGERGEDWWDGEQWQCGDSGMVECECGAAEELVCVMPPRAANDGG